MPKGGGTGRDVAAATRTVPDPRATHRWDGAGSEMARFTAVLGLPEDAWDVYLLYGRDARWTGEAPPAPELWMHQLGTRERPRVNGPWLDPAVLAGRARALLGRV